MEGTACRATIGMCLPPRFFSTHGTERAIDGHLQMTLMETLRSEAGVCSIMILIHRQTGNTYEKAALFTSQNPCYRLPNALTRHRFVRLNWRSYAQRPMEELPK